MKEVKDFVQMMGSEELEYAIAAQNENECLRTRADMKLCQDTIWELRQTPEYVTLKALAEQNHIPNATKLVITDEIFKAAERAYDLEAIRAGTQHSLIIGMKAALQAVFDHISQEGKKVEEYTSNDCWEVECKELVGTIRKATDLDKLKELTRLNFPKEMAENFYNQPIPEIVSAPTPKQTLLEFIIKNRGGFEGMSIAVLIGTISEYLEQKETK